MAISTSDQNDVSQETAFLKRYFRVNVTLANADVLDLRPIYQISFNPQFIHEPDFEIDGLSQDAVKLFFDSAYGIFKALSSDPTQDHIEEFKQMLVLLGTHYVATDDTFSVDIDNDSIAGGGDTGVNGFIDSDSDASAELNLNAEDSSFDDNPTSNESADDELDTGITFDESAQADALDAAASDYASDEFKSASSEYSKQAVADLFGGHDTNEADNESDSVVDDTPVSDDDIDDDLPIDDGFDEIDDDDNDELEFNDETDLVDDSSAEDDSSEASTDFDSAEAPNQFDAVENSDEDSDDEVSAADLPSDAFEVDDQPNVEPQSATEPEASSSEFDPYQKSAAPVPDQNQPAPQESTPVENENDGEDDPFSILADDDDETWYARSEQPMPTSQSVAPQSKEPESAAPQHDDQPAPQPQSELNINPDRFFNGPNVIKKFR